MSRLITIATCLALTLFLVIVFVWPKYQIVKDYRATIEEKSLELQYNKEYFSQIREISEELKKHEEGLLKISSALPSSPFISSLFNFLQKASAEAGLVLDGVVLGKTNVGQSKGVKETEVKIQLLGSYPAFGAFLSALEKSARLIEVRNVSFVTLPAPDEPPSFEISIKAYSY